MGNFREMLEIKLTKHSCITYAGIFAENYFDTSMNVAPGQQDEEKHAPKENDENLKFRNGNLAERNKTRQSSPVIPDPEVIIIEQSS